MSKKDSKPTIRFPSVEVPVQPVDLDDMFPPAVVEELRKAFGGGDKSAELPFLTVRQVAEQLGVGPPAVRKWIRNGKRKEKYPNCGIPDDQCIPPSYVRKVGGQQVVARSYFDELFRRRRKGG